MQFIKGMDISMIKALEQLGAGYYLKGVKMDVFKIFKECGANLIRLRLWNNPKSETGEPYGGGNNDLQTTIELAKRTITNDMRLMLDFHYSDFWADPAKQVKPKAWKDLSGTALEEVVYQYTLETLQHLKNEGISPYIVQVGNEITNGLLWPDGHAENTENMARLLEAGIKGIKQVDTEIQIMLHLDFGTDNALYRKWFKSIEPYNLEFDIIGMSYYPHWNGSLDKLFYNMNDISKTYDKDVLVAETSIGYTTDTLGCKGLVFLQEQEKATDYPATMEGQEQFLRDLHSTVRRVENNKGIGVVYWEPAWLPIPECTWAAPIGSKYMNDTFEAGNSMANQALFDINGNANRALLALAEM